MNITANIRRIEIMVQKGRYQQALASLQRLYNRCNTAEISLRPWFKRLSALEASIKAVIPNVE